MLFTISKVDCAEGKILTFPKIVEVTKPSGKLEIMQFKMRQNYFLNLNDIMAESNQNLAGMF